MIALAGITAVCLLAACGDAKDGGPEPEATTGVSEGTATSPVPAAPAERGYRLTRIIADVSTDRLLGLYPIPGSSNEALLMSQRGRIWRVSMSGGGSPSQFADISGRLIRNAGSEEGLLGLAFSPRFQSDSSLYLYYSAGEPRRSVLSRFRVSNGTLDAGSEQVLLEVAQPYPNHNGGQLAFGVDGYLYVALGDGGSAGDPHGNGQDLATLLGSILRLDVSGDQGYRVPADNPFVGRQGARGEIYAYGLRNPWRFSFDRKTNRLWAADVGQNRWEEIDEIVAGGNYGWNIMEGAECFRTATCDRIGLRLPRAVYGHDNGCSVTGGFVYRGRSMPELDGWYLYGDYCSGLIWAFDTEQDASAAVLLNDKGQDVTSFGELADGELVVITQGEGVYRLERGR